MTLVAEIRAGKTCPGCKSDCRHFINEADECIFNTRFSALFSDIIEDEADKEVQYESENEKTIIVKFR